MTGHSQQARVLLVDDNDMGRQMVRALLEKVGIEVVEAHNGQDAIDRVSAGEFDLVLMDMQMPVLSGYSAAQKIREMEGANSRQLPIIAMTANSFSECRVKSLAAGMNGHIGKPIDLDILYAELSRWLPQEKQHQLDMFLSCQATDFTALAKMLPRVDVKEGIYRTSGDQQLYLRLLNRFIDQFSTLEADLLDALDRGERGDAVRYVHTLKGVAGGLGAATLQTLAGQLERQLAQAEIPSMLDGVIQELNHLLAELKGVLGRKDQTAGGKAKSSGEEDELISICKQLKEPLLTLQVQDVQQLFERIKGKEWPQKYHKKLVELEALIEQYQFVPAADLIEILLDKGE